MELDYFFNFLIFWAKKSFIMLGVRGPKGGGGGKGGGEYERMKKKGFQRWGGEGGEGVRGAAHNDDERECDRERGMRKQIR